MKNKLNFAGVLLLSFCFFYLVQSFVQGSINAMDWTWENRFLVVSVSVLFAGVIISSRQKNKS